MKKFLEIYRPYMRRPIIYKAFSRSVLALAAVLLWNRFINKDAFLSVGKHAFFIVGAFFLTMVWFNYLRLDGMRIHHLAERKPQKKKKKRHHQRDIVDFVNEKVVSFDELEYDEQALCKLIANLSAGAAFLLMSLISGLF